MWGYKSVYVVMMRTDDGHQEIAIHVYSELAAAEEHAYKARNDDLVYWVEQVDFD